MSASNAAANIIAAAMNGVPGDICVVGGNGSLEGMACASPNQGRDLQSSNLIEVMGQVLITFGMMAALAAVIQVIKYMKCINAQTTKPLKKLLPQTPLDYKLTVVLDLDETLVAYGDHAYSKHGVNGVKHRPFVGELLEYLLHEDIEVIIWTAASKGYSRCVQESLSKLVPRVFDYRLYRTNLWYSENHVKDLSRLGRNLDKVLMVENRAHSGRLQPSNTILVPDFYRNSMKDDASLVYVKDVIHGFMQSTETCTVQQYLKKGAPSSLQDIPGKLIDDNLKGTFYYVNNKFDDVEDAECSRAS